MTGITEPKALFNCKRILSYAAAVTKKYVKTLFCKYNSIDSPTNGKI